MSVSFRMTRRREYWKKRWKSFASTSLTSMFDIFKKALSRETIEFRMIVYSGHYCYICFQAEITWIPPEITWIPPEVAWIQPDITSINECGRKISDDLSGNYSYLYESIIWKWHIWFQTQNRMNSTRKSRELDSKITWVPLKITWTLTFFTGLLLYWYVFNYFRFVSKILIFDVRINNSAIVIYSLCTRSSL